MKTKYKKELKASNDLSEGDDIKVGGLLCSITKVEDVFHYTPDSRVRLSLEIVGATTKKQKAILLLPSGTPIEVLT